MKNTGKLVVTSRDRLIDNLFTLVLVGFSVGLIYSCVTIYTVSLGEKLMLIDWTWTWKFNNEPQANLVTWKVTQNNFFIATMVRVFLLAYYQLCISTSSEMLEVRWLFWFALIILVSPVRVSSKYVDRISISSPTLILGVLAC